MLETMKDSTRNLATKAAHPTTDDAGETQGEVPFADGDELKHLANAVQRWRENEVSKATERQPLRKSRFVTWSGLEVPDLLTPADVPLDYLGDLGLPGTYPFTRGVQATSYRGR